MRTRLFLVPFLVQANHAGDEGFPGGESPRFVEDDGRHLRQNAARRHKQRRSAEGNKIIPEYFGQHRTKFLATISCVERETCRKGARTYPGSQVSINRKYNH